MLKICFSLNFKSHIKVFNLNAYQVQKSVPVLRFHIIEFYSKVIYPNQFC